MQNEINLQEFKRILNYLIDNNLPKLEHVLSKAEANKKVVLLGVKYW